MKNSRTSVLASVVLASTLALAACGDDSDDSDAHAGHDMGDMTTQASTPATDDADDDAADPHAGHSMDGGEAPEGIEDATDPAFPVGSEVIVEADHMDGMEGATGTVTGAFSTTIYSVSYTPTDGGDPVTDHRWVVQEELVDPDEAPLADGAEVVLDADHMAGMKGATATIDYSTQETVYMVDITTDDGMTMTNHKWVTESELRAAA